MKIIVVSDSHGNRDILERIVRQEPNADIYLHLGDSELPEYLISPFVSVKGNCDYFEDYPLHRIIDTPFGKIYAEHGHIHSHADEELLKKNDARIYLYGHTHCHYAKEEDGYYYLNPGSTSRPRDGSTGTYLVLNLDKEKFTYEFKNL